MLAEYGDYSLSMESINHNADRYLEGGETQPQQFERYLRRKLSYEIDFIDSRRAEHHGILAYFKGEKRIHQEEENSPHMNLSSMQTMIVRFTEKFFMNQRNKFRRRYIRRDRSFII